MSYATRTFRMVFGSIMLVCASGLSAQTIVLDGFDGEQGTLPAGWRTSHRGQENGARYVVFAADRTGLGPVFLPRRGGTFLRIESDVEMAMARSWQLPEGTKGRFSIDFSVIVNSLRGTVDPHDATYELIFNGYGSIPVSRLFMELLIADELSVHCSDYVSKCTLDRSRVDEQGIGWLTLSFPVRTDNILLVVLAREPKDPLVRPVLLLDNAHVELEPRATQQLGELPIEVASH